jgi:hypothetical protein
LRWEDITGDTEFLPEPPIETQWVGWIIDAFNTLSHCRSFSIGMSGTLPNPIAFSDINAYITLHQIPINETVEFAKVIQALDIQYRNHTTKKINKKK